ncbi:TSC2 [Cordylochernes scorpioides]|uniref:TSC2 n=1 Tax=Cordylochernes scorpioides TaxID=51811 RepID=A0ABY6KTL8_9ARAC|nr:TSC2 [Cordylochernes scorpioides]
MTIRGFVMDEAMEEVVEEEMNRCFEALKKHQAIDVNYIDFLEVDKDIGSVVLPSEYLGKISPNMSKGGTRDKSVQEKLRQFFGISRSSSTSLSEGPAFKPQVYIIDTDKINDLGPENDVGVRIKTVQELTEPALTMMLQDNAIEVLCLKTQDLLDSSVHLREVRHIIWKFYSCIVAGQYEKLDLMRKSFYQLIVQHDTQEDLLPRLELLQAVTNGGKDILYFEDHIGNLLLQLLPQMVALNKLHYVLNLLLTMVKYNSAYLNKPVIMQLIHTIGILCIKTTSEDTAQQCLEVMDSVICYSHLPNESLEFFIDALCRSLKSESSNASFWKVMNNLLGTSLGHSGLHYLCSILRNHENFSEISLLKGALFHMRNFICNGRKVSNLLPSYRAILSSLLLVLESNNPQVGQEIIKTLSCYLKKHNSEIHILEWHLVLEILEKLLSQWESFSKVTPHFPQEILNTLLAHQQAQTSQERIYSIIDKYYMYCPEEIVINFLEYRFHRLYPYRDNWLQNLQVFLEKYYKQESRVAIRIKVIDLFSNMVHTLKFSYETVLMDQAVLQIFSNPEAETHIKFRVALVQFLTSLLLHSCTKRYKDVLEILERILHRPFAEVKRTPSGDALIHVNETDLEDIVVAVTALINIFKKSLLSGPPAQEVFIFRILNDHLQNNYAHLGSSENAALIRKRILGFLVQLRYNSNYQLGLTDSSDYSAYIVCAKKAGPLVLSPTSPMAGTIYGCQSLNMEPMYQSFLICLKQERDWSVLQPLLNKIPSTLQNRALVSKSIVNSMCSALCTLLADKAVCDTMRQTSPRFSKLELHSNIIPVLGAIALYEGEVDIYNQKLLINRLQAELVALPLAITVLTTCLLELQQTMMKLLPNVLLNFSKITATCAIALPILEFLMILQQLPHLYSNFVEDQYMSIFAVTLPYTNPIKFTKYIAFLAHRLIIIWFLKCRIPFRKDFAYYITKGLVANMIKPFDEQALMKGEEKAKSGGNISKAYYLEMLEPKRSLLAEFLLEKGQSQSWIVDNKIVTVTTSGCGLKSFKNGVCENPQTAVLVKIEEGINQPITSLGPQPDRLTHEVKMTSTYTALLSNACTVWWRGPSLQRKNLFPKFQKPHLRSLKVPVDCIESYRPEEEFSTIKDLKEIICMDKELAAPLRRTNSSPEMSGDVPPPPALLSKKDSAPKATATEQAKVETKEIPSRSMLSLELTQTTNPVKTTPPTCEPLPFFRDRGRTISVMSPVQTSKNTTPSGIAQSYPDSFRSGLSPSYVFLQFYQRFNACLGKPLLIPRDEAMQRSLKLLDHILPYEIHKFGVVYVGPGQSKDEAAFLLNPCGTLRYLEFIQRLGTKIILKDVDSRKTYLGGLDPETDGEFAVVYHDDIMQVIFHIATLIPNKSNDPKGNNKKLHLANDFVCIVFNESGEPFDVATIKSQFISVCLDIRPCGPDTQTVAVRTRDPTLAEKFGHLDPMLITDAQLAPLVRQLAIQADLLCSLSRDDLGGGTWHARLVKIKKLYQKVKELVPPSMEDDAAPPVGTYIGNFTEYL